MQVPFEELRKWRVSLEEEIRRLELEVQPILEKLSDRREKLKALDLLVGESASTGETLTALRLRVEKGTVANPVASKPSGQGFTATGAYWVPILEVLCERGGRERSDIVLDLVQKKMSSILNPEDYELLPSGLSSRWRNRAQWQRKNMVDRGFVRRDSPRGIWEITPEGRAWLAANKRTGGAAA